MNFQPSLVNLFPKNYILLHFGLFIPFNIDYEILTVTSTEQSYDNYFDQHTLKQIEPELRGGSKQDCSLARIPAHCDL